MKKNDSLSVTVIIPCYNSEKYIGRCIDSVLEQSYKNFDILLINDGSKDNTEQILEEYEKKYKDKIIVINQENIGVAKTRNKGIKIAKGYYITFIDNDDFIEKDYLETLIENSEEGKMDIVLSGYKRPNTKGKIIKKFLAIDSDCGKFAIQAPWAKIYKKEFLIDNNLEFLDNNIGEDDYFNFQALMLSKKIKTIDYIGYNWFYNEKSVSNTSQKDFKKVNFDRLLDEMLNVSKEKKILEDEKNLKIAEFYFYKLILWFLLYSSKKKSYKDISNIYNKLFKWLNKNFKGFSKNKYITGFNQPKGSSLSYRFFYKFCLFLYKIHLLKFAIFIYAKI